MALRSNLSRFCTYKVLNEIMNTATEVDIHDLPIDLQSIKEELTIINSINQLDVADGLKGLLIKRVLV